LHELLPGLAQGLRPYDYWIIGLVAVPLLLGCILLHEIGHAVVARAYGGSVRGITLFLLDGVIENCDEPESPGADFLMAVAGPVVSSFLVVVFGLIAKAVFEAGWPRSLVTVLVCLTAINGLVLVFNLLPAYPLDGGRILRSILWRSTGSLVQGTHRASLVGQVLAWLLIGWGITQLLMDDWLGGIWLGLVGMFLNHYSQEGYRRVLMRHPHEPTALESGSNGLSG
jgi:Zn-dependent protease